MNEQFQDTLIRNQILLHRRAEGETEELMAILAAAVAGIGSVMSTSFTGSSTSASAGLLREVDTLLDYHLNEVEKRLVEDTLQLADQQTAFITDVLDELLIAGAVIPTILPAIMSIPMKLGGKYHTPTGLIRYFISVQRRQFRSTIGDGILNKKPVNTTMRELKRVVNKRSRQQLNSVVTTVFNAASDTARNSVYDANPRVFKFERWVSVLDNRTSAICQSLSGKLFEANSGPRPPAHFNCRSMRIPILDERRVTKQYRGTAPDKMNYQQWLTRQPLNVQNEVLGPTRAKLFREGGLKLDRFVNFQGKKYTLEQLRSLEPLAFAKVGV